MKHCSIITINYNNKEGLKKTIASVLNQTYKEFEYIIIDGGSTDGSVEVIKEYADKIDYWVSESDSGIYNAMNKGVLKAHGEYLNFMNSGDCFHDLFVLQKVVDASLEQDILIGKTFCPKINQVKGFSGDDVSMMDLYRDHPSHQAAFIKRELFDSYLYDESFSIASDWLFFIQTLVLQNCSYKKIDYIIADYDMEGISSTNADLYVKEETLIMKRVLPERVFKDYVTYKYVESPLLELIPELNKTAGFNSMICSLVRFLMRIYRFIKK
ncbi:MAG: glycosyltransferase [Bacteroides sp.]|nr:glycosyltransferase [Bacteroides sp.]